MGSEDLCQTREVLGEVMFSCTGSALEVPVQYLVTAFSSLMNYLLTETFEQMFGHYHYLAHPSQFGLCYKKLCLWDGRGS